ncbi:response regulator [Sphingobacterium sp. 1.A.4]|uniref:response regulator n=1 Tax=Sphingobacterium sp. 1.A.4 TaxID=2044603 RepID=UPI000C0C045A|nr:response regulator transcription factor [Sphingobacterium sp. 1.A.4]
MIRTIICDDHPLITQGLSSYLLPHEEIKVLAAAASLTELRNLLKVLEADVLLLDIQLPDGNGLVVCSEIKQAYPDLLILGLSNLDDRNMMLQMLQHGASGYLLKSAPMEEIVRAITNIAAGGIYIGEAAQKVMAISKVNPKEEIPALTRREKEVINYLAQGLSSVQMAELLFVSPATVDTHRRNLLQKFNVNKTVNLLQKVKDLGLM